MFHAHHTEAIKEIRKWLNEISYSTLNSRMMQFADQKGSLYPDFNLLMGMMDRINPLFAFIFSVFRLGQPTERSHLDNYLSSAVIDALLETGLLEQNGKYYRMPHVCILPLGGMYFVTGLPNVYPTVTRNCHYKPIDHSVVMMMDEIVSQPVETDFLEYYADYGILANVAAAKGFKNIQILPKHADYIPFIKINLALNHHEGEVVTKNVTNVYDLIVCVHQSVTKKNETRNHDISDEKDIIQLFPIFHQLKETGQAFCILESIGTMHEIMANERLKEVDGFFVQSIVLQKMPYQYFVSVNYVQTLWEKQFELVSCEFEDYARKTIESTDGKIFVFTQLLKINKRKNDDTFVLYPFYNPKYTDPLYNFASLTV